MKLTHLTFKELIENEKLTFLVGAGCSVDPPSCLPAGSKMMESIIKYTCDKSEIEKILTLEELRFEQLVEIMRDHLDSELKIIDYYNLCDKPNLQHFFLAEMIRKGNFVMTTNFDFLIEYALLHSGVPRHEIIPVITKQDFESYNNPEQLSIEGKKPIYKIHGSTKNIITEENTRDSLVATIQALGSNKEGLNVFQIEPFKRLVFDNISNDRSLIVIGYSGSDDFDIVPTLKILKNLQNMVWINYTPDDGGNEKIYEFNVDVIDKLDKINQILVQIKRTNNSIHVYRVDVNTTRIIKNLIHSKPELSSENFSVKPINWLKNNLKSPSNFEKNLIPYRIYSSFNMFDDAAKCLKRILHISLKNGDEKWKSIALNNTGEIYRAKGNYSEALKNYEQALKIFKELGDLSRKAITLNNIGLIYEAQGSYAKAIKRFEESLKIDEQLGNLSAKATCLNNIGKIFRNKGEYVQALKKYEEALKISEKLGDLYNRAIFLNNIGSIYYAQGNYEESLKKFKETLNIEEQLGNLSGKAMALNNIGEIFRNIGNYVEALDKYEEALMINTKLENLSVKAKCLNNIGLIYEAQGKYPDALDKHKEALKIVEQLGNLSAKAACFNNIASIYQKQGNYQEGLKNYEEALKIAEDLGDLTLKATCLNNIASIYQERSNFQEALKKYEEAHKIAEQLGNLSAIAACFNNIGEINRVQGNNTEALIKYEKAIEIYDKLGDIQGKAIGLNNIGMIHKTEGNYRQALRYFEDALQILIGHELSESPTARILKENIKEGKSKMKSFL